MIIFVRVQIVAVVAIICCVGNVFGYQTGAPPSQCVDMTPAVPPTGPHGTGQTTSSSPYIITTNASTGYTPGQTYSGIRGILLNSCLMSVDLPEECVN